MFCPWTSRIKSRNDKKYKDTLDVEWVVNDKDSIPNHREVHWQVTDVTSLIVILTQTAKQKYIKDEGKNGDFF